MKAVMGGTAKGEGKKETGSSSKKRCERHRYERSQKEVQWEAAWLHHKLCAELQLEKKV